MRACCSERRRRGRRWWRLRALETSGLGMLPQETVAAVARYGHHAHAHAPGIGRDSSWASPWWSRLSPRWRAGICRPPGARRCTPSIRGCWPTSTAGAQADVWTAGPDVPVSMSVAAQGRAHPRHRRVLADRDVAVCLGLRSRRVVPVGCRVGRGGWLRDAHGTLPGSGGAVGRPLLTSRSWHVAGLCGTGSKTVSVDGAFVPVTGWRHGEALTVAPLASRRYHPCRCSASRSAARWAWCWRPWPWAVRKAPSRNFSVRITQRACCGIRAAFRRSIQPRIWIWPRRRCRSRARGYCWRTRVRSCALLGSSLEGAERAGAGRAGGFAKRTLCACARRRSIACSARAAEAPCRSRIPCSASGATCTRSRRTLV